MIFVPRLSAYRDVGSLLLIALLYGGLALAGIELTRGEARLAAVWLPNAFLLAVLLRAGPSRDVVFLSTGIVTNIIANLLGGDTMMRSLQFALANGVEVVIACFATRWACGVMPDITKVGSLARFILVAVVAT